MYKMASQQHRIVRFLMILAVVLLTIFIYASYYSNLTMTIPTTRIHQQQASLISAALNSNNNNNNNNINNNNNNNNNNNDESSGLTKNSNSIFVVADRQNIDKIQLNSGQERLNHTTDDSNSSNGSSMLQTSINSTLLLFNNRKNSSLNDFMKKSVISTTATHNSSVFLTLQKQNVTNAAFQLAGSVPLASSTSPLASSSIQSLQSGSHPVEVAISGAVPSSSLSLSSSSSSSSSLTSSSVSSVQPPLSQQQQQQQQGSLSSTSVLDTSKGIPTISIYESGHTDMNPLLCRDEGESLRLFIAITSAPTHREARLAIRQTWGHYGVRRDVSIAFILGRSLNPAIEEALSAENYMYGDLIRGRFIDSYNNLTLKTISALEWVDKYCSQTNYVLKTDDDMFINVPKLLGFIDKHHNDKRTIFGRLAKKWKPIRNKKSKYYVSPGQFSLTVFPQFTTGPAYLLSSDIIHDLYIKSLEQTYLKLEDVYTTGIVAQLLNIKRVHVNEFLNRRIAFNPCNIRKAISVHMIKSNEQFDLWKKLLDTTTKCK